MSKQLRDAHARLQKFLQDNPQMQSYQQTIDKMLSLLPDHKSRMLLLTSMLEEKSEQIDELVAKIKLPKK